MTRALATLAVVTLLCLPGAGQQTALTDAHLRSAEIEIPQLVTLLELKPGMTASEQDLIAHCRSNLAHFKCPKTIVFKELPKTSTGKIQNFVLREIAKAL